MGSDLETLDHRFVTREQPPDETSLPIEVEIDRVVCYSPLSLDQDNDKDLGHRPGLHFVGTRAPSPGGASRLEVAKCQMFG